MKVRNHVIWAAVIAATSIPNSAMAIAQESAISKIPADRAGPNKPDTIICAATHQYLGNEISVRRIFNRDGTEVVDSNLDRLANRAGDSEIGAKIRRQLFDYVSNMVKTKDTDCSPNDPYDGNEIHVFDCTNEWQDGTNRFIISYYRVGWNYVEPDSLGLSVNISITNSPTPLGASFLSLFPTIKLNDPYNGKGIKPKTLQIRIGQKIHQQKVILNAALPMPETIWAELRQGQGDSKFTLYDAKKRVLQQNTFSHAFFADIETKLRDGYNVMEAKARDAVTTCKRLDSWEGGEDNMIMVT